MKEMLITLLNVKHWSNTLEEFYKNKTRKNNLKRQSHKKVFPIRMFWNQTKRQWY